MPALKMKFFAAAVLAAAAVLPRHAAAVRLTRRSGSFAEDAARDLAELRKFGGMYAHIQEGDVSPGEIKWMLRRIREDLVNAGEVEADSDSVDAVPASPGALQRENEWLREQLAAANQKLQDLSQEFGAEKAEARHSRDEADLIGYYHEAAEAVRSVEDFIIEKLPGGDLITKARKVKDFADSIWGKRVEAWSDFLRAVKSAAHSGIVDTGTEYEREEVVGPYLAAWQRVLEAENFPVWGTFKMLPGDLPVAAESISGASAKKFLKAMWVKVNELALKSVRARGGDEYASAATREAQAKKVLARAEDVVSKEIGTWNTWTAEAMQMIHERAHGGPRVVTPCFGPKPSFDPVALLRGMIPSIWYTTV